ncbi:TMhelix containing protein [Vibrio phage 1.084.O._10N.261.49.F5]|nr:TMhelix containing protein [Vibrio phage 1.084.O._10N.261.49.F5]
MTMSKKKFVFGFAATVITIPLMIVQAPRLTEEVVDVQVNRTFVKDNQYLLYTDKDTYEFDDSFAYFRFFPDEDWGKLKEKACYKLTTIGYRIKLPMMGVNIYENVVGAEEIECKG